MAVSVVNKGVDAFYKLRESFKISRKTREMKNKCEDEMKQMKFKSFKEGSTCKCARGIDEDKFEKFVTKLQARFDLPEIIKQSMLDGLDCVENQETVKDFSFKDGKGDIYHGRFVTLKKGEKMDIAYAIYTLSFELAEKDKEGWWWILEVVPIPYLENVLTGIGLTSNDESTKELSETEMDSFSKWCLVKLHNIVQEECGGEPA